MLNQSKKVVSDKVKNRVVAEIKGFLWALFFVMIVRTFLYQPFNIPTGSMIPTLLVGDFLISNKFCYGYSRQTFPFRLPLFKGRIFDKMPTQGEVVIFHNPRHPRTPPDPKKSPFEPLDYVKRLIGMPGDKIQVIKGVLHINGKALSLEEKGTYSYKDLDGNLQVLSRYDETLPNGLKHVILRDHTKDDAFWNNTEEYVVPEGHLFMMGDNRDHSMDSRWKKEVGFIPLENVMGRAEFLFFSTEAKYYEINKWFFDIRYNRLMTAIR